MNCHECIHHRTVPGDCHLSCNNVGATVEKNAHGVKRGWCFWPVNFDPVWIEKCDGFSNDSKNALPENTENPLFQLLALLRR